MVSAPSLTLSSHAHLLPLYTLGVTSVPRYQPITVMLALCTPLCVAIKVRKHYLSARTAWLGGARRVTLFSSRFFFTLVFFFLFSVPLLPQFFLLRFFSFIFLFLPHSSSRFCFLLSLHSLAYLHTLPYALRTEPSASLALPVPSLRVITFCLPLSRTNSGRSISHLNSFLI